MSENPRSIQTIVSLKELESFATQKLEKMIFDYYAGGAGDELTLRDNIEAFDRIRLRPRMLIDATRMNFSVTLFGETIDTPIVVAPMAFQRMAHEGGELAMARAAGRAKTIMTVSTLATASLEEVAGVATGPLWFQLYVYKDRQITVDLVERATISGYKAIVVTVDSPVLGRRLRDIRNMMHLPQNLKVGNLSGALKNIPKADGGSGLAAYIASLYDVSLTWKDLEWIAGLTKLPVLVKGVLRADDARLALESGAQGIVVSNHGGRQLDTTIATIEALPEVAEEVQRKVPVLMDGGIRRGTDVLKALARGADAVMLGRPLLWGLTLDGEDGAFRVLDSLNEELRNAMVLAGFPDVRAVTRDLLA